MALGSIIGNFTGSMAPFASFTGNTSFAPFDGGSRRRLQGEYLDPQTCVAYLHDPHHRFHNLWSPGGWKTRNSQNEGACWNNFPTGEEWFTRAWDGLVCDRNWYSGNPGELGTQNGGPDKDWVWPHFGQVSFTLARHSTDAQRREGVQ